MQKNNKNISGFAALLTIIIIGSATMIMAVSASMLSIGELEMSTTSVKGGKVKALAESCIEEGLRRIRIDDAYFATGKIVNINNEQCLLNISGSGTNRTVIGEALLDTYQKKIEVNISLVNGEITINRWEEKNN